jgi:hypothetical protein
MISRRILGGRVACAFLCAGVIAVSAAASHAAGAQTHFGSAAEAVQQLVDSLRSGDTTAMLRVLGTKGERLITSGDPVADARTAERFVTAYDEAHAILNDGETKATLQVGKTNWPLPIPLVKEDKGWRFDTAAGEQEVLNRRIGRNEHAAIQASLAYVDAQREYYLRNPQGSPLLHYASRLQSSADQRDGLHWEASAGEEPSPLGEEFARARAEGYRLGTTTPAPFHGYYYRILTAQGPDAQGGAYAYVAQDKMIGGFALVAYPARYGVSGVMTFIVNHDGVVFQRDLGPNTAATAKAMKQFNPDTKWTRVEDAEESASASPSHSDESRPKLE